MKKIIALLMALAMVVGMVACGAKEEAAAPAATEAAPAPAATEAAPEAPAEEGRPFEGVKISLWQPPWAGTDQAWWDNELAAFEEETGMDVEVLLIPWGDMAAKYMAGFLSGEGPDVFSFGSELMYDIISAGNCLDLSGYFSDEEVADQLYWSAGNLMGAQYAAPYVFSLNPRGVAYNMDLLKAAGVDKIPETREELIAAAKKVKEAGNCEYPVMYPCGEYVGTVLNGFLPALWSAGGDMVSADGTQATLNSDAALGTAQYLYDLAYEHEVLSTDCTGITFEQSINLFNEGKVAIAIGMELSYPMAGEADFEWDFGMGITDGNNAVMSNNAYDAIAVNANSENKDAAIALLKYLLSSEFRAHIREHNPSYGLLAMNASDDPIPTGNAVADRLLADLPTSSRGMPVCKGSQAIVNAIFSNIQLMMMDELTPAEAIAAMQDSAVATLNN